jgi:hypothetical protein
MGSTVAAVIAAVLIIICLPGMFATYPFPYAVDPFFSGMIATAGITAYRSAKKRRLGLKPDSAIRRGVETALLVFVCIPLLVMGIRGVGFVLINPTSTIIVPVWVMIAYIWVRTRKDTGNAATPSIR